MKIFANYLPQFHRIPENDKWWGEGFTDWVSCKNAKALFLGHDQPHVPLNNNYYDMSKENVIRNQAKMARQYGISGFGIYHYWFNSELNLLTRPSEIILQNPDIDIEYFFMWDNNSWKKTWSALTGSSSWMKDPEDKNIKKNVLLAELKYGEKIDWKIHFDYLLQHFQDRRYLKINGKPVFAMFNTNKDKDTLFNMIRYWDILAQKSGFPGIEVLSREDCKQPQFNYKFRYSPFSPVTFYDYLKLKLKRIIGKEKIKKFKYQDLWKEILKSAHCAGSNTFLSGFVSFDDTPRRGNNGNVVLGSNPKIFEINLKKLLDIAKKNGTDFILLTAWNEWGEGCHLEPDEKYGFSYLEAVKRAMDEIND